MKKKENLTLVFLDSSTVDLGDVKLRELQKLGHYKSYKNTKQSQILKRAKNADIIITNKCTFNSEILQQLTQLKLICVAATGVNNVDLKAAQKQKIAISNVAGYSTTSVAEHSLLFFLAASHRLLEHHQASIKGDWSQSDHFTLLDYPYQNLKGKTLGLVGYGAIGREVAKLAKAFGMKVCVAKLPGRSYKNTTHRESLNTVLKKSDFVSLHSALSKLTYQIINEDRLKLMKKTAFLCNLGRGALIDEKALVSALKKNQMAGFLTDLTSIEPPSKTHPFFQKSLQNKIVITPHVAWASLESRQKLLDEITLNIKAFLSGKKRNRLV